MGALGGTLKSFSAPELAARILKRLLQDTDPAAPWEVILGQAVQAGAGPNPARAAAQAAGMAPGTAAFTINQGSASGLQAVFQAALSLQAGTCERILAGGMESSSSAPYLLPTARWGTRMGSAPILDALLLDGQDAPQAAFSAAGQAYARLSVARALAAREAGQFRSEILELIVPGRRGTLHLTEDEPRDAPGGPPEPFDGAAVLSMACEDGTRDWSAWRERQGLGPQLPLARIKAIAQGTDAAQAIQQVLGRSGLTLEAIDRFELEDGSPDQLLHLLSLLPGLSADRINLLGGALALGEPLGATGARMVASLAHQLRDNGLRYGITAMDAHGSGLALLLEHP